MEGRKSAMAVFRDAHALSRPYGERLADSSLATDLPGISRSSHFRGLEKFEADTGSRSCCRPRAGRRRLSMKLRRALIVLAQYLDTFDQVCMGRMLSSTRLG